MAAALDSVEYLHDVASVAIQYSYLASWLCLLAGPVYSADTVRALFKEIYGYWTTLPKERRPKLYLHGLSLGALNSQESTDLIEALGDPFAGALWTDPPHSSRLWRFFTDQRTPGSPAWPRPELRTRHPAIEAPDGRLRIARADQLHSAGSWPEGSCAGPRASGTRDSRNSVACDCTAADQQPTPAHRLSEMGGACRSRVYRVAPTRWWSSMRPVLVELAARPGAK